MTGPVLAFWVCANKNVKCICLLITYSAYILILQSFPWGRDFSDPAICGRGKKNTGDIIRVVSFPSVSCYPRLSLCKHFAWKSYLVVCSLLHSKHCVWGGYTPSICFNFPLLFPSDLWPKPRLLRIGIVTLTSQHYSECREGVPPYYWHMPWPILPLA